MKKTLENNPIVTLLKKENRPMTPHEIAERMNRGKDIVHRNLKKLLEADEIEKLGSAPKVYYRLVFTKKNEEQEMPKLSQEDTEYIEKEFVMIDPSGKEYSGIEALQIWCKTRKRNIEVTVHEFLQSHKAYMALQKNNSIDATEKIRTTFQSNAIHLDHLFFLYPYSIPVFGKTKIAAWLFYGKQTQNMMLIRRVLDMAVPEIESFLQHHEYDALAFVPPTVPRTIQFMSELKKRFEKKYTLVPVEKVHVSIRVQQKSLKDLEERIHNAESTFVIPTQNLNYKKVLLIDDFTGSGSTLNILAGALKRQHIAEGVDGLTITGSMNGFEIIKEV